MRIWRIVVLLLIVLAAACGGNGGPVTQARDIDLAAFERELSALPLPDGVEPALWTSLKDELRSAVNKAASERAVSSAPDSELSAVNDFAVTAEPDNTATFNWTYRNQGDYNQDKLVSVNDLTPIGLYFNAREGDPDWDEAQLADGDHNGLVTVSDITPIGQYYKRRVEGYKVYRGATPGELGDWQEIAAVEFESGAVPADGFRPAFSYHDAAPVDEAFYRVRPYDGEQPGIAGNYGQYSEINLMVTVQVPEVLVGGEEATWTAEWENGTAPFTISWDFGGGAANLGPTAGESPDEQTVTMINDSHTDSASYAYTVTIEDSYGLVGVATGGYAVAPDPHPVVTVTVPAAMQGSLEAIWSAEWIGGTAPFTISWDFGGGAPNVDPEQASSPDLRQVVMSNDSRTDSASYSYVVAVIDDLGNQGIAQGQYEVGPDPHPLVSVTEPTGMTGGSAATWTATWIGGSAPYTLLWDFGGGGANLGPLAASSPFASDVTMINPSPLNDAAYSYELTVTDAGGYSGIAAGDYVVGPAPNLDPTINSAVFTYKSAVLVVKVSDPNSEETLSVAVTEPPGLHADSTGKTASSTGPLAASFSWYADDPSVGGTGMTTVTVTDSLGATDETNVEITIPAGAALYAIPQAETASVGEPVTILVTTDTPGYPFQFVSLLSVTVEPGAALVSSSFNVGAIGGSKIEADGIWAAMGPSGFTLPSDYMIWQGDNGGDRERWEFFLFPLNGSDLADESGDLFNFQFTFDVPGTYTLGFVQETSGVARTYYTDEDEYSHFWGDLSNDHEGIPNNIVVTE